MCKGPLGDEKGESREPCEQPSWQSSGPTEPDPWMGDGLHEPKHLKDRAHKSQGQHSSWGWERKIREILESNKEGRGMGEEIKKKRGGPER